MIGGVSNEGRLTDVPGIAVGHWSDPAAKTGCTVIVLPEGTVGSGEVRGGAPASREFALLDPTRTVANVDAVVLTGGSAFGLAAADGVMRFLEAQGRGFSTPAGRVPIVPALGLFDLAIGDASVRPDAAAGFAAATSASTESHEIGSIGAGTGCTVDKWRGPDLVRPGGIVAASARVGPVVVATLIAVNAAGSIGQAPSIPATDARHSVLGANTTIGVVATSAGLTKSDCRLLAISAHDGLARAIFPPHTRFDGDAFVVCATGAGERIEGAADRDDAGRDDADRDDGADIDALRAATVAIVEAAIASLS